MVTLFDDLRHGSRRLAQRPTFTAVTVLSLALGIGANAAIFSLVDAILLRPLPVPDASRVLDVSSSQKDGLVQPISYPDYADYRDHSRAWTALIAYADITVNLGIPGDSPASADHPPRVTRGLIVSGNFFDGLQIAPELGRVFRADEDRAPGADPVLLVSHSLWERWFSSDPNLIDQTLDLNGRKFTVIGVLPKSFTGMNEWIQPDVYVPMRMQSATVPLAGDLLHRRDLRWLRVKGRLAPGVTANQAAAEMKMLAGAFAREYPDADRGRTVQVQSELRSRIGREPYLAALTITLVALAGLVLLIACVNVANLMLAQAVSRVREIATRLALGASRTRIVRQLLSEALLLSVAGAAAGILLAVWMARFLTHIEIPSDFPVKVDARVDARVLGFTVLVSVATALLFGLAPALRSARTDLIPALKDSAATMFGRARVRIPDLLVSVQMALSLLLLVCSALFVRSFRNAQKLDPGFHTQSMLIASFDPSLQGYSREKTRTFYRDLLERTRALGGVRHASLAATIPFGPESYSSEIRIEGYQPRTRNESLHVLTSTVEDDFFETMGTPILRGRSFRSSDTALAPRVAIVNEQMAERFWPSAGAIGKRILVDGGAAPWIEIVGIAKTARYLDLTEARQSFLYIPYAQNPTPRMTLVIHHEGDAASTLSLVRNEVRKLDPGLAVYNARSLDSLYRGRALMGPRITAGMIAILGAFGLMLALIGVYGVAANAAGRRTREMAIRLALGAQRTEVLGLILWRGLALSAAGELIGIGLYGLAMHRLPVLLIDVNPADAAILTLAPAGLLAAAVVASYLPARRAATTDPMASLRHE